MPACPGRIPALLIFLLLAACTRTPPDPFDPASLERDYRPATAELVSPQPVALRAPLDVAIRAVAAALPAAGLEVQAVDPASGQIAAVYSGEAEPWLDCGTFVPADAAEAQRLPSARLLVRIVPPGAASRVVALRQLRLDARMVISGVQNDDIVELTSTIDYLVTRTIDAVALDGRVLETRRETLVFDSGRTGRLDDRLVCRSNGKLEQLLDAVFG